MTARTVRWADVLAHRLRLHALDSPSTTATPADVASAMCGVHAQIATAAEWSIGVRIAGRTRTLVQDALWGEHSLVKTYGPRGTVHLLATRDLPVWSAALAAVPSVGAGPTEEARLGPDQGEEVVAAIAAALAGAELTVDELGEAVIAATGPWAADRVAPGWYEQRPRWEQAMLTAARRGVLCFGPARGRRSTFTNPQRWAPGLTPADEKAALASAVSAYLRAFGPATATDLARWLAAPPRWAAQVLTDLGERVEQVDVDGRRSWRVAGDDMATPLPPAGVRLLPYFDAYAVGGCPRDLLFPGRAGERALAGGQAGNYPVLLLAGEVRGIWHGRRAGRRLHVTVEPFVALDRARRSALEDEVDRLGAFVGATPTLTIGTVTVGPHA